VTIINGVFNVMPGVHSRCSQSRDQIAFLLAKLSTTWRTSARHHRPLGFFTAHSHRPAFLSAMMLRRIADWPWAEQSSSMPRRVWPKQKQITSSWLNTLGVNGLRSFNTCFFRLFLPVF